MGTTELQYDIKSNHVRRQSISPLRIIKILYMNIEDIYIIYLYNFFKIIRINILFMT